MTTPREEDVHVEGSSSQPDSMSSQTSGTRPFNQANALAPSQQYHHSNSYGPHSTHHNPIFTGPGMSILGPSGSAAFLTPASQCTTLVKQNSPILPAHLLSYHQPLEAPTHPSRGLHLSVARSPLHPHSKILARRRTPSVVPHRLPCRDRKRPWLGVGCMSQSEGQRFHLLRSPRTPLTENTKRWVS